MAELFEWISTGNMNRATAKRHNAPANVGSWVIMENRQIPPLFIPLHLVINFENYSLHEFNRNTIFCYSHNLSHSLTSSHLTNFSPSCSAFDTSTMPSCRALATAPATFRGLWCEPVAGAEDVVAPPPPPPAAMLGLLPSDGELELAAAASWCCLVVKACVVSMLMLGCRFFSMLLWTHSIGFERSGQHLFCKMQKRETTTNSLKQTFQFSLFRSFETRSTEVSVKLRANIIVQKSCFRNEKTQKRFN